jgi:predicted phage terminase large subunit-like protein
MIDHNEVKKELSRRSFKHFVKYTKHDYQFNWHHELICKKLQDFAEKKIKRLILTVPPRHGKSELASRRFVAWLFGRDPKTKIIGTSYSAELASSFNRDIQRIIDTPNYRELFPSVNLSGTNVRTTQNWLRNNDIFEIVEHGGAYRCAGVGGAVTGSGGNFLLVDDPLKNYEEAKSPTIRQRVWEWYTSTLYTRQEKDACILIIQTRWHEDDLAGRLIELSKTENEYADQWEVINIPAICEVKTENDPREIGDALWPEKYSIDWLLKTKNTLGSMQFSALYQQRPTPDEGIYVKPIWLKYYETLPDHFEEIVQSWDLTFGSVDNKASFVVGSVYGKIGSAIYLIDKFRGQWNFTDTIKQIEYASLKHQKTNRILIEKKANGQAVIDTLQSKISGIIPVTPDSSKESRLSSVLPYYEAGNVFYPKNAHWIHDHVDEVISFPNGKFDDSVDAESQALNYFKTKKHGTFTESMADLQPSGFDDIKLPW